MACFTQRPIFVGFFLQNHYEKELELAGTEMFVELKQYGCISNRFVQYAHFLIHIYYFLSHIQIF